jgi:hypothetical protein
MPGARKIAAGRLPDKEVPEQIPGLKAWFDAGDLAYFTLNGSSVSAWVSRGGSLGTSLAFTQGTASSQPTYSTGVSTLNYRPAVQFDGTADFLNTNDQNAWTFLHDGTGASKFTVFRMDSTGPASQRFAQTTNASATERGFFMQFEAGLVSLRVSNGSGTWLNIWNNNSTPHYVKDNSRWQMWGYVDGTQYSRVSNSTLTNSDDVSQDPSSGVPTRVYRVGASSTGTGLFKGWIAADLYYDHVLTNAEITALGTWANRVYGVAI